MALTRRRTRTVNLFGMVVDESLHTHSAYIEHVAARHTGSTATCLRSASTDTAAAASNAHGYGWGLHGGEM
jgi:hypothetical protein